MNQRADALCAPESLWLPYIFSYGMGAESTAALVRILTDPVHRPVEIAPDFHNLVVVCAQTGDEWGFLGTLVETYVLPLLRRFRVRFVEVARRGPQKRDGIAVLQDSRVPAIVHLDGVYKLSQENRHSGTMPQLSGHHTCALKSKGEPLDAWRATEFADASFYHAIGYNVDEKNRIKKDRRVGEKDAAKSPYAMSGRRRPRYPVSDWGMTRADCVEYLLRVFRVVWPKSACRQCPYISLAGWVEQLKNFISHPLEAIAHLVDEYVCLALNPRSALYGPGKSLGTRLARDGADEVVRRADERMDTMTWAVYRVRRRFTGAAVAPRSVQKVLTGPRHLMPAVLDRIADLAWHQVTSGEAIAGAPKNDGDTDPHHRIWVQRRDDTITPTPQNAVLEEFYTIAPAQAMDKALSTFEDNWLDSVPETLLRKEELLQAAVIAAAEDYPGITVQAAADPANNQSAGTPADQRGVLIVTS